MQMCDMGHMAEEGPLRHACLISDFVDLVVRPFVCACGKQVSPGVLPLRQSQERDSEEPIRQGRM